MSATQAAPARDRLRIAIQKSGRLAEPARNLLSACGLSWRESRDKLFCYGESLPVDLLLVRDDDIPGLIADGVCDLGIVGRNELDEQAGGIAARSACRRLPGAARAGLRPVPADAGGARGMAVAGSGAAGRHPHRHQLPGHPQAVAGRAGRGRAGGRAVRFGGNRPAPGYRRPDLRSGLQRRHAARQPVDPGAQPARQRGGAGRCGARAG
jgi:hypothetical protein